MFILLPDSEYSESESETGTRRAATLAHLEENLNADNLKKLFATLRVSSRCHIRNNKIGILNNIFTKI
jgi:hypothetical protein